MNDVGSVVNSYLGEVRSALTCSRGVKRVFLKELRPEVEEFAEGKENLTVEALSARFGTPEEIEEGFTTRDDYKALLKKAKRRTVILTVVTCAAVIVMIAVIICAKLAIDDARDKGQNIISPPYSTSDYDADYFETASISEQIEEFKKIESKNAETYSNPSADTYEIITDFIGVPK